MSTFITVHWQRAGVQQSPDLIQVQKDNMSIQQASYYGGTQPYDRYNGYVETTYYKFQFKDLLVDTVNIDPITQQPERYRIINQPEAFEDFHYELVLDKVVGT